MTKLICINKPSPEASLTVGKQYDVLYHVDGFWFTFRDDSNRAYTYQREFFHVIDEPESEPQRDD